MYRNYPDDVNQYLTSCCGEDSCICPKYCEKCYFEIEECICVYCEECSELLEDCDC